jgi:hypothetical protein
MIEAKKIVARFLSARENWEGKFLGQNARLRWDRHTWLLEELPQKGKKNLKVAQFDNLSYRGWYGFDAYIAGNILRRAGLGSSDDFDKIKEKMLGAFHEAAEITIENLPPEQIEESPNRWAWLKEMKWSESTTHYLKIEPEDTEPFTAKGKDFTIEVSWTKFSTYSPDSDFQLSDPHYTQYESSSPTAARKLYQILRADPTILKNTPWDKLDEFFKKNRIGYETHFSVWH